MDDPFNQSSQIRDCFRKTRSAFNLKAAASNSTQNDDDGFISKTNRANVPTFTSSAKAPKPIKRTHSKRSKQNIQQHLTAVKCYSFNDVEILENNDEKPPAKRPKTSKKVNKEADKENFPDDVIMHQEPPIVLNPALMEPKSVEELAVNTKRIAEVREWLDGMKSNVRSRKILLLTGPCGCGKTATLKCLCAELGIDFVEFDPPQQQQNLDDYFEQYEDAQTVFEKFIRSVDTGSTEKTAAKHRLICIENIPNAFYRDPATLKKTLIECASHTRCMIVFVMSTMEKCYDYSPAKLFPPQTLMQLGIREIKFLAIPNTIMTKALKRIFDALNIKVSTANLKQVVEQADGDIRSAINNIQFTSTKSSSFKAAGLISAIDHLNFFHYIGKVMYAKRAVECTQEWRATERKLNSVSFRRNFPPKDDTNYLIENNLITGTKLADYIFDHEPKFAPTISSLSRVFRDICDFDACQFGLDYENQTMYNKYYAEIGIRSAVFNNYKAPTLEVKSSKTNQLYHFTKPQITEVTRIAKESKLNLVKLLPRLRTADMFSLTAPLLSYTRFYMREEEKKIINTLSLKDKMAASKWGNVTVKVNPRIFINKTNASPRTTPYLGGTEEGTIEEEYEIYDSDEEME